MLFWIAGSNFIVPALFSLAQIIIVFKDGDLLEVNLIILTNTSVAIIGVVFATLWSGSNARSDRSANSSTGSRALPSMIFQPGISAPYTISSMHSVTENSAIQAISENGADTALEAGTDLQSFRANKDTKRMSNSYSNHECLDMQILTDEIISHPRE
jgi:hypothetical protein